MRNLSDSFDLLNINGSVAFLLWLKEHLFVPGK